MTVCVQAVKHATETVTINLTLIAHYGRCLGSLHISYPGKHPSVTLLPASAVRFPSSRSPVLRMSHPSGRAGVVRHHLRQAELGRKDMLRTVLAAPLKIDEAVAMAWLWSALRSRTLATTHMRADTAAHDSTAAAGPQKHHGPSSRGRTVAIFSTSAALD